MYVNTCNFGEFDGRYFQLNVMEDNYSSMSSFTCKIRTHPLVLLNACRNQKTTLNNNKYKNVFAPAKKTTSISHLKDNLSPNNKG